MYEFHTAKDKKEKLADLSALIRKVAVVPEQYLSREETSGVIEYLCDIEYDLIKQLNQEPHNPPPEKEANIEILRFR